MDGFRLALFATAVVFLTSSSAIADEPTVEELLKTVPVLSPDNKALSSFQCVVAFPVAGTETPRYVKFRIGWTAPNRFSCLTVDDHTNVPFMFGAENKLLLYDATSASLTIIEPCNVKIEMQATETEVNFSVGFSNDNGRIRVDLPSLLRNTRDDHVLTNQGGDRWQITATSKSGRTRLVALFDMSNEYPIQSVEIRGGDADLTVFGFTDIRINQELDASLQAFPPIANFPPDLQVKQIKEGDTGFLTTVELFKRYTAIWGVRLALFDQSRRKNFLVKRIDWDAAQRTDEIAGPSLRVLFGLPEK